jgi:hypothetical protein
MKLRDRFKKQLDTATPKLNRPHFQAQQCEKIADDYAIEFAKWIIINCNHKKMEYLDLKELLEIFKKEKGL